MAESKQQDACAATCANIDKSFNLTGLESIVVGVALDAVMDTLKNQLGPVARTPSDRARLASAVVAHVKALVDSSVAAMVESGEVRL